MHKVCVYTSQKIIMGLDFKPIVSLYSLVCYSSYQSLIAWTTVSANSVVESFRPPSI